MGNKCKQLADLKVKLDLKNLNKTFIYFLLYLFRVINMSYLLKVCH